MRATDNVDISAIVPMMKAESLIQRKKHGYNQTWTLHEWLGILTEEVGELAQAINDAEFLGRQLRPIRCEAVQVATIAAMIALMEYEGESIIDQNEVEEWD